MNATLLRAIVTRLAVLAGLWWAVAEGSMTGWYLAVPVVLLAAGLSLWLQPPGSGAPRLRALPSFGVWFMARSIAGGVDVARRALRPRVDVAPGEVDVPVWLPAGLPRVTLADAVSLLPGTLAVEVLEGGLRVHVLDVALPVTEQVAALERRIGDMYGLAPPNS